MPRLLIRKQAENDLDDIWWYIAQDNPQNADKFLDLIEETCGMVSNYPHMGENRNEILLGLHSFPVGNYLIFYLPLKDGIDVVRILHGSRSLRQLFN